MTPQRESGFPRIGRLPIVLQDDGNTCKVNAGPQTERDGGDTREVPEHRGHRFEP